MNFYLKFLKSTFYYLFLLRIGIATGGIEASFPHPVDIVYLWVDGSDSDWQKIRDVYAYPNQESVPDGNTRCRFSDNDELKYSLRSVLQYAPFFNHIYIVTMSQIPKWFEPHPKITIVDHGEIFNHQEHLPTFNSMAIEANLHRIPNLSEHFIYFNDDMFLGNYVEATDFFSKSGKVKVMFERYYSPSGKPMQNEVGYIQACKNANNLLNQTYQKKRRLFVSHAPYALRKSYMESSEQAFSEAFTSTSSHKFRSPGDYTITNGLVQYHWIYTNRAEAQLDLKNVMILIRQDRLIDKTKKALNEIYRAGPHTFCLQDKMTENDIYAKFELHRFLEEMYPNKAPWEK